MKRLVTGIVLMTLSIPTYAGPDDTNEVCKRRTMVMLVLEHETDGEVLDVQPDTMTWKVKFGYDLYANTLLDTPAEDKGIIIGRATCNEIEYKSSPDGSKAEYAIAVPGDANTFLKATAQDSGKKCWCKMDGPVTSWWVYVNTYNDANECLQNCTNYCATGFADKDISLSNNRNIRHALFDAIW